MKEIFQKLLKLYPGYKRVYGPYLRKDGRKHILLYKEKGSEGKRTLSWPKALVEVRENRRLTDDETVDHNDKDFTNNSSDNLIIRKRSDHAKLDVIRLSMPEMACVWCGSMFTLTSDQIKKGKGRENDAGPFCSKSCSGKYGRGVQLGAKKRDREPITREYVDLKGRRYVLKRI